MVTPWYMVDMLTSDKTVHSLVTETAQGNQDANDIGDFYYAPPTDYLALCTSNLSDPEIKLPGDNFNTMLYDDGAGAEISGVGFQPDLGLAKIKRHWW